MSCRPQKFALSRRYWKRRLANDVLLQNPKPDKIKNPETILAQNVLFQQRYHHPTKKHIHHVPSYS